MVLKEIYYVWFTPQNNHSCTGHDVQIRRIDDRSGEVLQERNCCSQSGSCKYEIGEIIKLPDALIWELVEERDNYGNSILDPDNILRDSNMARWPETPESITGDNGWYNEKYQAEIKRYNSKIGIRWDSSYA